MGKDPEFSPQSYAYVEGSPTSATDPSGRHLVVNGLPVKKGDLVYDELTNERFIKFAKPGEKPSGSAAVWVANPVAVEIVETMINSSARYERTLAGIKTEIRVRRAVVSAIKAALKGSQNRFGFAAELVNPSLTDPSYAPTVTGVKQDIEIITPRGAFSAFFNNPQNYKFDCLGAATAALAYGQTVRQSDAELAESFRGATFQGLGAPQGFFFRVVGSPQLRGEYLPGDLVEFSSQTASAPWTQEWTIYSGKQGGVGTPTFAAYPLFEEPVDQERLLRAYNRRAGVTDARKGGEHFSPRLGE